MPADPATLALLWDMRRYADTVMRLIADKSFQDYLEDEGLRLGVERALQIIGEAASQLTEPVRVHHPEIEWRRIVGLRHILVHGYTKVDNEIIWVITGESVPVLQKQLTAILDN